MADVVWSIYRITNLLNNKIYIGQTKDPKTRWSRHKSDARLNKNYNCHLYDAMRKYGLENFIFEILIQTKIIDEIDQLEIDMIKQYRSMDRNYGYNKSNGGKANKLVSSETREKISKAKKGQIVSEKTRNKLRIASTGKKHTEEAKKKISITHIGKQVSEVTRKKLSIINTGKKYSKETLDKKSKSMIGKNAGEKNGMFGKKSSNAKLTQEMAREIRIEYLAGFISMSKLAKKYDVSKRTILNIIHETIYKE